MIGITEDGLTVLGAATGEIGEIGGTGTIGTVGTDGMAIVIGGGIETGIGTRATGAAIETETPAGVAKPTPHRH